MALSTEPTYITGIGGTGNINSAQRMVDIPDEIFYLEQDMTPLVFLARGKNLPSGMKVKQRPVHNPEFKVLNKVPHGSWLQVSATTAATTGDTAINLAITPTMVRVGTVLVNPETREHLYVSAYSTVAKTITVTRAYGTTTATTISVSKPLRILHPVSAEGAAANEVKSVQAGVKTNYAAIIRRAFGATNTAKASELYGGPIMEDNEKEAWIEFRKEWEAMLLWGEPKEDTSGTHPVRVSGGIDYWIRQGSATTQTDTAFSTGIKTFLRNLFRYGQKEKAALCSPDVVDYFDQLKEGKLQMRPTDKTYGISTMEFDCGHGRLYVIRDVMLENSPYGTGGYGGRIYGLDMEDIMTVHMKGRDAKLNTGPGGRGIQANDEDAIKYEYIGELGLHLGNPDKHRIWSGITGFS